MSIIDILSSALGVCFRFLFETMTFYDDKYGVDFSILSMCIGGAVIGFLLLIINVLFARPWSSSDLDDIADENDEV